MSKAVLISIQPKWCELIANGEKAVEVRKSAPKMPTPFKCYIYCTLGKPKDPHELLEIHCADGKIHKANGRVIGEFVCEDFTPYCNAKPIRNAEDIERRSCLSKKEIWEYEPNGNPIGWHISDLVIYDEPKLLSEFVVEGDCDCLNCKQCPWLDKGNGFNVEDDCNLAYKNALLKEPLKPLFRPPQSWCYVEKKE